jgi:adenine-specific DNA-methyltransferase
MLRNSEEQMEADERDLQSHQRTILESAPVDPIKRIKTFPTTRYFGSKRHQLPWLYESLKSVEFSSVLDAFGGTSSTSLLFKAMGKQVTFNDALQFNVHTATVLLANSRAPLGRSDFEHILKRVKRRKGFISQTFQGMYFTDEENEWLDGLMIEINKITGLNHALLMYCLFQAALQKRPFNLFHRANLYLRTCASITRSFGNLTTWQTPFVNLMLRAYDEYEACSWDSKISQTVLASSDAEALCKGYDLVYLDPPYFKLSSHTESYSLRYHFLEGLCNYDQWPSLIDRKTMTKRLLTRSPLNQWDDRRLFKDKLFQMIEKHRESIVALSYVAQAYPSIADIRTLFRQNFRSFKMKRMSYKQALSKNGREELLFIGYPRNQ